MCQEECPEGLVRSFAVEVEEGNAYWESLDRVCANDCRLLFRGMGEGGGVTRGGLESVLRGLISGDDVLDGE
jgi:hypothetical protein